MTKFIAILAGTIAGAIALLVIGVIASGIEALSLDLIPGALIVGVAGALALANSDVDSMTVGKAALTGVLFYLAYTVVICVVIYFAMPGATLSMFLIGFVPAGIIALKVALIGASVGVAFHTTCRMAAPKKSDS